MKNRAIAPRGLLVLLLSSAVFNSACRHHSKTAMRAPRTPQAVAKGSQPNGGATSYAVGYTEEGVASWYGVPYHGRPAADGEIYDMEKLVAAHRTMPFHTWIKVTNLANNQSVQVRVIDRGPFVGGRILDLSKAAARDIGLLGPGVGRVRIEVIAAPRDVPREDFYAVQAGAFSSKESAEGLRAHYAERFGDARLVLKAGASPLWRVLVGKEPSLEAAQQLAIVLASENKSVFVVRLDPVDVSQNISGVSNPGR